MTAAPKSMTQAPAPTIRLKPLALPTEHGGWSLLLAPILLGLLLLPTLAGFGVAIFGLGGFLFRHPFRLALSDLRRGKRYPRTAWAVGFAAAYLVLGAIGLLLAVWLAEGPFWLPLLAMAVAGAVQFSYDLSGRGRHLVPEIMGTSALALLAASIVLAAGGSVTLAVLATLVLVLQEVPAVMYAQTRLKLVRNQPASRWSVFIAHLIALATMVVLVALGFVPWVLAALFALFLARAVWGLSKLARNVKTPIVGVQEIVYALMAVFTAAAYLPR